MRRQGTDTGRDALFAGAGRVDTFAENGHPSASTPPAAEHAEDASTSLTSLAALRQELRAPAGGRRRLFAKAPAASLRQSALDPHHVSELREARWPEPFVLTVASPKGGVGRTPAALVLAGVIATVRGARVCVMETSEAAGQLLARAEHGATHERGLSALLRAGASAAPAWLPSSVAPQTSGADVLGSPRLRDQLTGEHVRGLIRIVAAQYDVLVLDTGANQQSAPFTRSLEASSALLLVTTLQVDAVLALVEAITDLRRSPRGNKLADRAVIVVTDDGRPTDRDLAQRLRAALAATGVSAIADVPYDPLIASGRELSLSRLTEASQRAWLHACALIATATTA